MTQEAAKPRIGRRILVATITLSLMIPLYPLSLGPFLWLEYHGWIPAEVAYVVKPIFYGALERLYGKSEGFARFMDTYLTWWSLLT